MRHALPRGVRSAVRELCGDSAVALELTREFAGSLRFERTVADKLIGAAQRSEERWGTRCLAAGFLNESVLALDSAIGEEFRWLCSRLKMHDPEEGWRLEGILPAAFSLAQLQAWLSRRCGPNSLLDVVIRCREVFGLGMARWLFSPEEAVPELLKYVCVSSGIEADLPEEAQDPPPLPAWEARFAVALSANSYIFWVDGRTPALLNSLIEHPPGTVALVVKPPASGLEFELKRAGKKDRALGVLYERDGRSVPFTHRLQGGSPGWMLDNEAQNSAKLARLFLAVHGRPAPISSVRSTLSVNTIPHGKEQHTPLQYFGDPDCFGQGFEEMRNEMRRSIEAGCGEDVPFPQSEFELTVMFLRDMKPRQSLLAGTSSFRIETLCKYLDAETAPSGDPMRFAGILLEELLGVPDLPRTPFCSYAKYLDDAFQLPRNKTLAIEAYLLGCRDIGVLWGTLMASGSYSLGESFAERNVGLRSVWRGGKWVPALIFMDHDCLMVPDASSPRFFERDFMAGTRLDERHI